jgi:hypothetical protein
LFDVLIEGHWVPRRSESGLKLVQMLEQVIIGKNVLVPDVGYPTCRTQGKSQQCVLDRTIGGYEEITEEGMREE